MDVVLDDCTRDDLVRAADEHALGYFTPGLSLRVEENRVRARYVVGGQYGYRAAFRGVIDQQDAGLRVVGRSSSASSLVLSTLFWMVTAVLLAATVAQAVSDGPGRGGVWVGAASTAVMLVVTVGNLRLARRSRRGQLFADELHRLLETGRA